MLTECAVQHFGSRLSVAKALNLTKSAVYQWGKVVPHWSATRLERLTDGQLCVDETLYDRHGNRLHETFPE